MITTDEETTRTVRVEVDGGGEVVLPPRQALAVADAIRRAAGRYCWPTKMRHRRSERPLRGP